MRTSLTLVIAISFLAAAVSAVGRNRDKVVKSTHPASKAFDFHTLTAQDIERICQQTILDSAGPYFHGWVIKALQRNLFKRPREITENIQGSVNDHLEKLNNYVKALTEASKDVAKYSRFNFDVKVQDLIARANDVLQVPHVNPFDTAEKLAEVEKELGGHAHQVVTDHALADVDRTTIEAVGKVFAEEDKDNSAPADAQLKGLIANHKQLIIKSLYKIIEVFTNSDEGKLYGSLNSDQKDWLQAYFDAFKYLLPEKEHHAAVIKGLTKQTAILSKPTHAYVNKDHFKYLLAIDSEYKPYFNRDDFITHFNPKYRLEELHDAAIPALFSWNFFDSFNNVNYIDALRPDEDTVGRKERLIARLHNMLYKVYTMARDDHTLPPTHADDNKAILKKLYTWVKDTKLFSSPTLDSEGALVDLGKKNHELFPAPKFQKYFLPLLDLICQKLGDDCDIQKDKSDIVNKFVEYNVYPIAKDDQAFKDVLTPGLLDQISRDSAVKELETFTDNIMEFLPSDDEEGDELFENDNNPQDFDQMEAQDPHKPSVSPLKPLLGQRLKKAKINPKAIETIPELARTPSKKDDLDSPKKPDVNPQAKFDKEIGDKFLPKDKVHEPEGIKNLETFIKHIDTIGNPNKKRNIQKLLAKFLITSKNEPLIKVYNKDRLSKVRGVTNFPASAGFRNFLFRSMQSPAAYVPDCADDEYNYGLDVAFFITMANMDEKKRLNTLGAEDQKKEAIAVPTQLENIANADATLKKNFYQNPKTARSRALLGVGQMDSNFIERADGVELLRHILGFFKYYEEVKPNAEAVAVDYYRYYLTFYQIVAAFRRGQIQNFKNPQQYVLLKLEECMNIADAQDSFVGVNHLHVHCVHSYRKYAEVYYFYKMYLLAEHKNVDVNQSILNNGNILVHARAFLVFATSNQLFASTLTDYCAHGGLRSICQAWTFFNSVIYFLRAESVSTSQFQQSVDQMGVLSAEQRINLINGLEAALLHTPRGNNIIAYRFDSLFARDGVDTLSGLGKALKFTSEDHADLSTYLSLTYKKLLITPNELAITEFVQEVLNSEATGDIKTDKLLSYLAYGGRVVPLFIKLFLQYAVTRAQFERLARVLIDFGISTNLVHINNSENDDFFRGIVMSADEMKKDKHAIAAAVKETLQAKYAEVFKQCVNTAVSEVREVADDDDMNDYLNRLIQGDGLSMDDNAVEETEKVDTPQKPVTKTQVVEISLDIPKGTTAEEFLAYQRKELETQFNGQDIQNLTFEIQEREVTVFEDDYENEEDEEEEKSAGFVDPFMQDLAQGMAKRMAEYLVDEFDTKEEAPQELSRSNSGLKTNLLEDDLRKKLRAKIRKSQEARRPKNGLSGLRFNRKTGRPTLKLKALKAQARAQKSALGKNPDMSRNKHNSKKVVV